MGPATLARIEPAAGAGAGPVVPIDLARFDGVPPVPYPREGDSRPPYPPTGRRVELHRNRAKQRNRLAVRP